MMGGWKRVVVGVFICIWSSIAFFAGVQAIVTRHTTWSHGGVHPWTDSNRYGTAAIVTGVSLVFLGCCILALGVFVTFYPWFCEHMRVDNDSES